MSSYLSIPKNNGAEARLLKQDCTGRHVTIGRHWWCNGNDMNASSAIDRSFKPRSGKTKHYQIGVCCFSAKHSALKSKTNDVLLCQIICLKHRQDRRNMQPRYN
jgi:hypothetical protein